MPEIYKLATNKKKTNKKQEKKRQKRIEKFDESFRKLGFLLSEKETTVTCSEICRMFASKSVASVSRIEIQVRCTTKWKQVFFLFFFFMKTN